MCPSVPSSPPFMKTSRVHRPVYRNYTQIQVRVLFNTQSPDQSNTRSFSTIPNTSVSPLSVYNYEEQRWIPSNTSDTQDTDRCLPRPCKESCLLTLGCFLFCSPSCPMCYFYVNQYGFRSSTVSDYFLETHIKSRKPQLTFYVFGRNGTRVWCC